MSPDPSTRVPDVAAGRPARDDAGPGATTAAPEDLTEQSQPGSGSRARGTRAATVETWDERSRHRSTSPRTRRLGLIDYTLLGLIVLGVAITVAMAIVNP